MTCGIGREPQKIGRAYQRLQNMSAAEAARQITGAAGEDDLITASSSISAISSAHVAWASM
jgi:hypothetical protein